MVALLGDARGVLGDLEGLVVEIADQRAIVLAAGGSAVFRPVLERGGDEVVIRGVIARAGGGGDGRDELRAVTGEAVTLFPLKPLQLQVRVTAMR